MMCRQYSLQFRYYLKLCSNHLGPNHGQLQSLLDEPNPNSPANSQAAQLYQENRREYEKKVLAIVEESWMNI